MAEPGRLNNICDVPGVLVGNATDPSGMTGCTAVLFDGPATVGVDVRGSSPGTRETDRLSPTASVNDTHAILLTGGSAFGLAAAEGVVKYLEEQHVGLDVGVSKIPLVSAAVIFDLMFGSPDARPDLDMGYEAAKDASSGEFRQGNSGAGTGATVGKVLGPNAAMKGGLGSASVTLEDGIVVAALVVVNAFGEVRENGEILAGPRLADGSFGDTLALWPEAATRMGWNRAGNTTLGIVATNARLGKTGVAKVSRMAHDGFARAIHPVHTTVDGDVVFAASIGEKEVPVDLVGSWGARMTEVAIHRAVRSAKSSGGLPGIAGG